MSIPTFAAVDFETANRSRDSACAIAIVRVEQGVVRRREVRLIRPPTPFFEFTAIHGIAWKHVRRAATFPKVWEDLNQAIEGVKFIAAHNAPFDRSVLTACCMRARIELPDVPFVCTVRLARQAFGIRRADLVTVCRRLRIPLNHHDPLSDAEACARIVLAATLRIARKAHPQRTLKL